MKCGVSSRSALTGQRAQGRLNMWAQGPWFYGCVHPPQNGAGPGVGRESLWEGGWYAGMGAWVPSQVQAVQEGPARAHLCTPGVGGGLCVSESWMGTYRSTGRTGLSLGPPRAVSSGFQFMSTRVTWKGLGHWLWVFSAWGSVLGASSLVPLPVPLEEGALAELSRGRPWPRSHEVGLTWS